ncbi:MAG: MBL fold metallo-hydrolase [Acidobacteriota bacterium]
MNRTEPIFRLAACIVTLLLILTARPLSADSVNSVERLVTRLSDGVWEIRHKDAPDGFPQGNTTVIIGEREVLVVDSCYMPSSAREDIAQIRQWTSKPVRYLVNTHWHYDHTMGNGVYAAEFPGLEIIAQSETRKHIQGYNPGWFERYPKRTTDFRKELQSGKDEAGKAITAERRKDLTETIPQRELVQVEFHALVDQTPNIGFDEKLTIDLGNREVQIMYLGKGNTTGDAVIYLPSEKILMAGDLLDHPVPYLGGGYPVELIGTLEKMAVMDIETIVPGHGEVLHGKDYIHQVSSLLKTVVAAVSLEIYRIGNGSRHLDEVQAAVAGDVDMAALRQQFAGSDKDNGEFFDGFSMKGLITAAYAELWGR